jgi:hypothetical protein
LRKRWNSAAGVGALVAICVGACSDPVDKAAKKRIFSPEDPPKVVSSAGQKLDPEKLAENPQTARRVLRMGAAEATERLGPHQFNATVQLEWMGAGRDEQLIEKRALIAGAGGVSGDFQGTVDNSRDQGLEVIRVNKTVYARNRYGKFRQRLRDRGIAEREREEIYGVLRDFDQIFGGRLKLTSQGNVVAHGRPAWKYAVSLLPPESDAGAEEDSLPPLAPAKGGLDESTARRIAFFRKRQPRSVQGELVVDQKSAVVLQARLDGKLEVPSPKDSKEKDMAVRMAVELTHSEIGKAPALKAPADFLPDADKPLGIAAALDRFGIPRGTAKGKDAGVEAEQGEEESDPGR